MNREHVIIGDVHGCIEELNELLNAIDYKSQNLQLVFVGDYVNRGPDSIACVRRVRELCEHYGAKAVAGNHEYKHIKYRSHEICKHLTGKSNPMRQLSDNDAKTHQQLTNADIDWMRNLPLKLHLRDTWWAIHGGLEPIFSLDNQSPNQIIRCRYVDPQTGRGVKLDKNKKPPAGSIYWTRLWKGEQSIVYGHCVHSLYAPVIDILPHDVKCVGIDTGCVFGGYLTAYFLEQNEFMRVKAKKEYFHINFLYEDEGV